MSDPDPKPSKPNEPGPNDCCGEGCAVCVWDLYEKQLEKYERDLKAWEAQHTHDSRPFPLSLKQAALLTPELRKTIEKHVQYEQHPS